MDTTLPLHYTPLDQKDGGDHAAAAELNNRWGISEVLFVLFIVSMLGSFLFMVALPLLWPTACIFDYISRGADNFYFRSCRSDARNYTLFQAAQCCQVVMPNGLLPTPSGAFTIVTALCVLVFAIFGGAVVALIGGAIFWYGIRWLYEHRVPLVKTLVGILAVGCSCLAAGYALALMAVLVLKFF